MSEQRLSVDTLELQRLNVNQSLTEADRILVASGEEDVRGVVNWVRENTEVSYTQSDPMNLAMTRLVRPSGDRSKLALVFVGEGNSAVRQSPDLRTNPQYVPNMHAMFVPSEVQAHFGVLAGVLVHEGTHAFDTQNPDFQQAAEAFPGIDVRAALSLLTEIHSHEYEGKLLNTWFGKEFDKYIQSEVDAADKAAIENQRANGGLLIEAGLEPSVVGQHLEATQSFIHEADRTTAMELLASALPSYIMLRTIDQIVGRNQETMQLSPTDILKFKLGALGTDYLR